MKRSLPEKSRRRGKKRLARLTATMSHPLEQIEQIKKQRETLLIKFVVNPQVESCQAVSGSEERPRRPEEGQLPPGTGTGGFRIKCWSASQKNCSINLLKKPHALVYFPFFLNWRQHSVSLTQIHLEKATLYFTWSHITPTVFRCFSCQKLSSRVWFIQNISTTLKKSPPPAKSDALMNLLYILETDRKERSHHLPVGANTKMTLVWLPFVMSLRAHSPNFYRSLSEKL